MNSFFELRHTELLRLLSKQSQTPLHWGRKHANSLKASLLPRVRNVNTTSSHEMGNAATANYSIYSPWWEAVLERSPRCWPKGICPTSRNKSIVKMLTGSQGSATVQNENTWNRKIMSDQSFNPWLVNAGLQQEVEHI